MCCAVEAFSVLRANAANQKQLATLADARRSNEKASMHAGQREVQW
jgi:hypothetical protein